MTHERVDGTNNVFLPTSEIPIAVNSIFLRICQAELHWPCSAALAEQRANMCCAFTHQLYSIRWAHWTQNLGLPLAINLNYPYKTSHLRYRIVLHMFSVAFYPGFPGIEQPKKSYWHGWRDVKKIQTGKKKRCYKRDKPSSLTGKSATHYQTQSAHLRTQVMQRHRPKVFGFFSFSGNGRRINNTVWVVSWAANNVTELVYFILCYYITMFRRTSSVNDSQWISYI